MEKIFVDRGGLVEEFAGGADRRRHVRFPLCLKVEDRWGRVSMSMDFILNIGRGGVYILTEAPLKKGAKLKMQFFIPPTEKLLGEFNGKVVGVNTERSAYPHGMHIQFVGAAEEDLRRLEALLEENRHLVDDII